MSRLPIVPVLMLATLCGAAPAEGPSPSTGDPEPIATRNTVFSIPFQIPKAEQPAQQPLEVRLYVSTDRGSTWRPYARVAPADGQFLFRAGGDGEYWFVVRTLDKSGQLRPQGANRPELRVVVDTTPPKLDLEATRGDSGQITARWKVTEQAPKPDSLKLNYRTAPDAPWEPVTIDLEKVRTSGGAQTGEVTWVPPGGATKLEIRAEVTDTAGNPAVSHAQAVPERNLAAVNPPDGPSAANAQWRPARREGDPAAPAKGGAAAETLAAGAAAGPGTTPATTPGGVIQTAQRPAAAFPETSPGPRYPYSPPGPATDDPGRTATAAQQTGAGAVPPSQPVAGAVSPAVQKQFVPPAPQDDPWAAAGMPPGPRPRMVNSRVFELEYDLGGAASAPGRVELWGTRDAGKTWKSFGQDTDGRTPMIVTVPEEGIYGFRVVVSPDQRTPAAAPPSGELPDVWIGVDLSKPTARILSAERGQGDEAKPLVICWEAADRLLAARPVSLFYSESGSGGNWSTIATGLENSGQYAWTIPPHAPERVYIRLEVRDESGNLTVVETPQAVVIEQRSSGAKIRDVRPVSPSAQGPRRYNFG